MNPNWERWSTRRARRRHAAMNTKMLRKNPPVEGIPSTLEEAKKQRMGLILDAVNREPARLRVVAHERLDPLDPEHGTWRIAFEGEGRAAAVPGDMLYLERWNRDEDVEAMLDRLKADGKQMITVMGYSAPFRPGTYHTLTLREALKSRVDMNEATTAMLKRGGLRDMARHNEAEMAAHMRWHRKGEKKGEEHPPYNPYRVYLPSLLESLPGSSPAGRMSARRLVGLQDRMFPRPYTMARFETLKSGSGGAFRAEITVSEVDKEMHEPDGAKVSRPARSSSFLSSLKAGDELSGWVLPEMHHFPTTLGRDVPLIVVVTGSGISGLMSLLRSGYTGGPLWLICGVRSWKHKSLYGAELEAYRNEGTIARLDAATSRPVEGEGPKRRVQRLLWDERRDVASWLKDGAALYLSGRLSMGRDVRGELGRILVDQGMAANADKAEETLKEWEGNLRLQASVSGV